jgi:hypothetical protein
MYHKAVEIRVERFEGPSYTCNRPIVVKTFAEATKIFRNWSVYAPKQGYHKCGISVKFDDGEVYESMYYLTRKVVPVDDYFCQHLGSFSGRFCPEGKTRQEWDATLNKIASGVAKCKKFLYYYHFRDDGMYKIDLYDDDGNIFCFTKTKYGWRALSDLRMASVFATIEEAKFLVENLHNYDYQIVPAN